MQGSTLPRFVAFVTGPLPPTQHRVQGVVVPHEKNLPTRGPWSVQVHADPGRHGGPFLGELIFNPGRVAVPRVAGVVEPALGGHRFLSRRRILGGYGYAGDVLASYLKHSVSYLNNASASARP
jgi:hypothetical protein